MTRYFGKICQHHPDLNGERLISNRRCVQCAKDKKNALENRIGADGLTRKQKSDKKYQQKEKPKLARKLWRESNPEKMKSYRDTHYTKNKGDYIARARARQHNMVSRSWEFEKEDLNAFYENCPSGFHVDHIIPLNGKLVSGLHVLSNLQYLTSKENISKRNSYEVK